MFQPARFSIFFQMLMRGQAYKVFLDLEMPPSPTNERLGKIDFQGKGDG